MGGVGFVELQDPTTLECGFSASPVVLQSLGTDWDERVLPSIGNEIIKAVVAQYNAEQLLTQRDKVSRAVSFGSLLHPSLNTLSKPRMKLLCLIRDL